MGFPEVAVLFARRDSVYKSIPGCDVWDADRDALNWKGGTPGVFHPPCRAWGRLRHFARPRQGEMNLALWAVCMARVWGGVIEHPAASVLLPIAMLPEPGHRDAWGGWTLAVPQQWWGHRAEKNTRFYIVGCAPSELPTVPLVLGESSHVIAQNRTLRDGTRLKKGMPGWRPEVTKVEREATPPALAAWLVDLARRCRPFVDKEGESKKCLQ